MPHIFNIFAYILRRAILTKRSFVQHQLKHQVNVHELLMFTHYFERTFLAL